MKTAKKICCLAFIITASCTEKAPPREDRPLSLGEEVLTLDFNQSLFRDCINFLDAHTEAKIIMDPNILQLNDISITYNSNDRDVLKHVENMINLANEEYSLHWHYERVGDIIYIKESKLPAKHE